MYPLDMHGLNAVQRLFIGRLAWSQTCNGDLLGESLGVGLVVNAGGCALGEAGVSENPRKPTAELASAQASALAFERASTLASKLVRCLLKRALSDILLSCFLARCILWYYMHKIFEVMCCGGCLLIRVIVAIEAKFVEHVCTTTATKAKKIMRSFFVHIVLS